MEVNSLCEHNNKENIPPLIFPKQIHPFPLSVKSSNKNAHKRSLMIRKPLMDITHLFSLPIRLTNSALFAEFQLHSSISDCGLRKRKVVDLREKPLFKSMRRDFR